MIFLSENLNVQTVRDSIIDVLNSTNDKNILSLKIVSVNVVHMKFDILTHLPVDISTVKNLQQKKTTESLSTIKTEQTTAEKITTTKNQAKSSVVSTIEKEQTTTAENVITTINTNKISAPSTITEEGEMTTKTHHNTTTEREETTSKNHTAQNDVSTKTTEEPTRLSTTKTVTIYTTTTIFNPCTNNPCNEGNCSITDADSYNCTCLKGWAGKNCTDGNYVKFTTNKY